MTSTYDLAKKDILGSIVSALKPPKLKRVSEGIAEILKIARPGSGVGYWDPAETPYMIEPVDMLASRKHSAMCFVGPSQAGKCLDIETPIATPNGWKLMGDIKAGDYVFNENGRPVKVLKAHAVKYDLECFELEFRKGEKIVCDAEHLWGVNRFYWKAPRLRYEVLSVSQMLNDYRFSGNRCRYTVDVTKPLMLEDAELSIDPYIMGAWLGNGMSNSGSLSSWNVDEAFYVDQTGGVSRPDHESTCIVRVPGLTTKLRAEGLLGNKSIPHAYAWASEPQRRALLQGLMDTDGSAAEETRAVEFSSVLPTLATSVYELICSLGYQPSIVQKKTTWTHKGERKFGTAYRITFSPENGSAVFRLPRKRDRVSPAERSVDRRSLTSITRVDSRPVRCIQVDSPTQLFLAGTSLIPTHNTVSLGEGWMAHTVVNDPGDMIMVQMSETKAKEYSKQRIKRAIDNSPRLQAMKLETTRGSDAIYEKTFRNGMIVKISWPSINNVSSTSYRYCFSTDYDRVGDSIDGEGDLFSLLRARTRTFMSRGMTAVESSPGRPFIDPQWKPLSKHEAPPCKGILAIYNRGDRRRWYWHCPHCTGAFEAAPGLGLFNLPNDNDLMELVRSEDLLLLTKRYSSIVCPLCATEIPERFKKEMNRNGVWLSDGQSINPFGEIEGEPLKSDIASYYLGGVAAAYQTWPALVLKYLQGIYDYITTGSEETLQTSTNTDQCMPYMSMHLREGVLKNVNPAEQKDIGLERYIVPDWARCVVCSVDVQGGANARFIVQAHAVGPFMEQACIDRYEIKVSRREGSGSEFAPIDPSRYAEDWDILTDKVVRCTYRTTVEGREIRVKMTVVDTGGEEGVADKAYQWYRNLSKLQLTSRVMLAKGNNTKTEWIVKETRWGRRSTIEKGDVIGWMLNPNALKDQVFTGVKRDTPGPGYIHFPKPRTLTNPVGWVTQAFFDELFSETRNADGTYRQIRKRNETLDLCVMIRAACLRMGLDKVDWENGTLPGWLLPLDRNTECISSEARRTMKAEAVAPMAEDAVIIHRRRIPSPYAV